MKTDNLKIKKMMPYFLIGAGVILLIVSIMDIVKLKNIRKEDTSEDVEVMLPTVPDAEDSALPDSKSDAYGITVRNDSNIDDYWNECEDIFAASEKEKKEVRSTQELFGNDRPGARTAPRTASAPAPGRNPWRETPEERARRHERRKEETIDMAQRIAGTEPAEEESGEEEKITLPVPARTDGVISSLDDGWNMDNGISTLDEPEDPFGKDVERPVRCMFAKELKIRSGQRVPVILMEDILVSGTVIPKHTHIMATCQIGERMTMELSSIEMGGRIIPLGYEAWDIDGSRGIYCPETGKGRDSARRRGRDIVSSHITGLVGGIARDVISTGAALMNSRDGEITVTVPAGYTFFIMHKKEKR